MPTRSAIESEEIDVSFPAVGAGDRQDREWCEVRIDGETRRIRFHDYHEIYAIPGLYERLFYEELKCDSPRTVCSMLVEAHIEGGRPATELNVLDVGAGNGMVGEELKRRGVGAVVGVDIIEEAAEAVERDRPDVYEDYLVLDMTDIPEPEHRQLRSHGFNALTCVAALGFDDIPPDVFANAFDLISPGGLIGISIKEEFMSPEDQSGFSQLIRGGLEDGTIQLRAQRRYRHRLSVDGEPLNYIALVAEKGNPPATLS